MAGRVKGSKNVKDLYEEYQKYYRKAVSGRFGGEASFREMYSEQEFRAYYNRMKQLQYLGQEFKGYSNVSLIKALVGSQRKISLKFRRKATSDYKDILRAKGMSEKQAKAEAKKLFTIEGKELREELFKEYVQKKIIEEKMTMDEARASFEEYYY